MGRYAQFFQGEKESDLTAPKVAVATVRMLKDALQLASVIQFDDILALDTVKACAKGKDKALTDICKLFLNGDVKDLDKFHKGNEKMFKEHGLVFEDLRAKMRLITLATKVHGKSEIS